MSRDPSGLAKKMVDDEVLLSGIANGDLSCLNSFYDRYSFPALGLATKICGNRTVAEDVVQDAFLSIWGRPGKFDSSRGTPVAFLMGVVHHKAVDAIRRETSLRRREELAFDPKQFYEEDLVELAWLSLSRERMRSALKQLSPAHCQALELAYVHGLTYVEVATHLEIPLGTAKTRMRDGMIKLKALVS